MDKNKILSRIRGLQAKTMAAGCTEAEAAAAADLVDQLLAQYELTLDEVSIKATEVELIEIQGVGEHAVRYAGHAVAQFCEVKWWLANDDRDLAFLGLEVDVQIAEYLMMLFWRAIERETSTYRLTNLEVALARGKDRSEKEFSFQVGMGSRLGERLKTLRSKRDLTANVTGQALMIVKQPMIDEALETLGIKLYAGKSNRKHTDNAAFNAGRTAADKVQINAGVGRSGSGAGRIK